MRFQGRDGGILLWRGQGHDGVLRLGKKFLSCCLVYKVGDAHVRNA